MTYLAISLAKVLFAVGLLVGVLALASRVSRTYQLEAEHARKAIHVSLGLSCLVFPALFAHAWEGALTCALAIGVFALARGRWRRSLGCALHGVKRRSHGEVYFALAVAILFALYASAPVALGASAFVLPVAVLTISDAAAALVGSRFGRTCFAVGSGTKSWEGVAAFALTALVLSQLVLSLFSELTTGQIVLLSIMVAITGAAIEAVSTRGLDNLFIPLGLFAVLCATTASGFDAAFALAVTGASASLLAMLAAPQFASVSR